MGLFRDFLLILAGGAIGSVLGTGFGVLVGVVSPEFMAVLTHPRPVHAPERVGAALGMIGGLRSGRRQWWPAGSLEPSRCGRRAAGAEGLGRPGTSLPRTDGETTAAASSGRSGRG